ncbi:MAG: bifunctional methylenetetrahydrofolate dehydrogenase/methenyltetrahydrofolate cyclohydrolase, partial [Alphaproteobacteria bacterium]|nr:bifunctional methylenetetrahydrofolate dehydrogenase/methenyltetrahydrofolate cyclohydrolase [Alphaproteobacteria bacterium]
MSEAKTINGKEFAASLRERVGVAVTGLKKANSLTPGLAVVLVGEDPASQIYVRN